MMRFVKTWNWVNGLKRARRFKKDAMPELVKRRFFRAAIGVTFGEKIYNPDRLLVVGRDSELDSIRIHRSSGA